MSTITIAIDGPAGAGKSTVAKNISKALGIVYLDTGAMYRAVALKAIRSGIDTTDADRLGEMVKDIDIKVKYINNEQHIYLDGEDVSSLIRTPEVSIGASNVAVIPAVRIKLVEIQRKIAQESNVVMDGRDIGTYVLPNAKYKFFVTASIEERAHRRYMELKEKGADDVSLEEVAKDIAYRDKNDSSRAFAPLMKAADAIEIDTTGLDPQQTTDLLLSYLK